MSFIRRGTVIGALTLVCATPPVVSPAPGKAQISLQDVQPFGEVGLHAPIRDLGKLTSRTAQGVAQIRARSSTSPTASVGLEVPVHPRGVFLRGELSTTLGGGSSGQLAGCRVLEGLDEGEGDVCRIVEADGEVRTASAHAILIRPVGPDRLFPFLSLGAGIRKYSFTPGPCAGDDICELHHRMLEDQAQGTIHLGLGTKVHAGPVMATVRVGNLISRYDGPRGEARGEIQNDVTLSLGLSLAPRY